MYFYFFLYTILCIKCCYKSIKTGLIHSMSIFIGKWFQFSNKSISEQFVIMFDIRDSTVLVGCVWHKPGHRAHRTHSMIIRMISEGDGLDIKQTLRNSDHYRNTGHPKEKSRTSWGKSGWTITVPETDYVQTWCTYCNYLYCSCIRVSHFKIRHFSQILLVEIESKCRHNFISFKGRFVSFRKWVTSSSFVLFVQVSTLLYPSVVRR